MCKGNDLLPLSDEMYFADQNQYTFDITNVTMAPDGFAKPMMVVNGQYPGPVSRMIKLYVMVLTPYRPLLRIGETTSRSQSQIILQLTVLVFIGTALGS
jgi:hypothetical protein